MGERAGVVYFLLCYLGGEMFLFMVALAGLGGA